LLGEHGIGRDTPAGRAEFSRRLQGRQNQEQSVHEQQIRRGWCLGSEEFRKELLAAAIEKVGANHYGSDRRQTDEQKAQALVKSELKRLDWAENELRLRPKGDPAKVAMARQLRKQSTMSLKWIADRLQMGSWSYVSNLLRECK
jgi:hypothetical protein